MPLNSPVPWIQKMKQHGEWWLNPQNVRGRKFLHPRDHDVLIFADASNTGWGAHLNQNSTGGLWSQVEKQLHINVLELKAVILTLFKTVHQEISASSLRQHQCSTPHKQTRRNSLNRAFCPHVETPYLVQQTPDNSQSETRPKVTQCHCGRPLQEEPNSTHRVVPVSQIFKQITRLWEHPQIDLFATNLNTKPPTYVSPIPDPQAWAVDALNISWKNIVGYAISPTAFLSRVFQKLQSQECRLILIAPGWPTKPWFWDLVKLFLDHPRQLPPICSLLKQPLNNQFHSHPESLNLHAWYLGIQPSRTKVSLQKWQIELLHLKDSTRAINAGASKNR